MKKIITITGAAGNIAYSLIFRILSGNIFHQDTKIQLNLLDISSALPVLMGVKLEIEDCAFKQLEDVVITDKPEIAFAESDYILLVGAKPRSKGMQRADLLLDNANIFQRQAEIIDNNAKKTSKNKWEVFIDKGRERTGKNVLEWAKYIEIAGAGELHINSIDKDGTFEGFDYELIRLITKNIKLPIVVGGGLGEIDHIKKLLKIKNIEGVTSSAALHYKKLSIKKIKEIIKKENFNVRI